MKEYTQADWDEYAEWSAEAAKAPYEELDAPWIVVNRGPDDIHPARSKWEAYQIAKSLNYSFESFLMVNPDTALESWATPWRREEFDKVDPQEAAAKTLENFATRVLERFAARGNGEESWITTTPGFIAGIAREEAKQIRGELHE